MKLVVVLVCVAVGVAAVPLEQQGAAETAKAVPPPPPVRAPVPDLDAQVTGRGKMKHLGPLIAAGIMKMGMVGVLAFKALALLVGKALLVAKLAFLLAAVIGLKKLFTQDKHVTYEVVAHPHHSHSHVADHGHDSYSSGWGRAIEVTPKSSGDPHNIVYRAHAA